MADPKLVSNVSRAEGCKLIAYRDGLGNWTIGYGHLLDQTIDWTGHEISQATADAMLAADLDEAERQAEKLPEWRALDTACRQDAIIEAVFNLGISHWIAKFPLTRAALQAGSWVIAAAHLRASPEWIAQVGRSRVARLAWQIQSGSYLAPQPSSLDQ